MQCIVAGQHSGHLGIHSLANSQHALHYSLVVPNKNISLLSYNTCLCCPKAHTHKDSQAVRQVFGPNQQVYVLALSVVLITESDWCCRLSKTCLCWSPTSSGLCYQVWPWGYASSSKGGHAFDSMYVLSCMPCNSMYAPSCMPCNSMRALKLHVCPVPPCMHRHVCPATCCQVYPVTPCMRRYVCPATSCVP